MEITRCKVWTVGGAVILFSTKYSLDWYSYNYSLKVKYNNMFTFSNISFRPRNLDPLYDSAKYVCDNHIFEYTKITNPKKYNYFK